MNSEQAKDFLVQHAKEQVQLDGISFSELEARMMYFTESDDSCENPLELNEEFEAKYDTAEYEAKVSRLLHRAYNRLKDEDSEKSRNWNLAIRTLRKGDHYLLVLWDLEPPSDHQVRDFLKPVGIGVLIALVSAAAMMFAEKYGIKLGAGGFTIIICALVVLVMVWTPVSNWVSVSSAKRRTKREK